MNAHRAPIEESGVNLRHAAALALVGWYLMLPPIKPGMIPPGFEDRFIDTEASISKWSISSSFDSAQECDDALVQMLPAACKQASGLFCRSLNHAQCIATDDPRLKGQ